MPLFDVQQALTPHGRIRMGHQVPTGSGGTRPAALDTWRLTSPWRAALDRAAELWGGDVRPFKNDRSPDRWDLITTVDALPIMVLPGDSVTQWYELWSAAGNVRRCDGRTATHLDGHRGEFPCACDPDPALRECDPHTRLSLMLPPLGLGLWRLDSQGGNAARELAAVGELLARATSLGWSVPATLNIAEREWRGLIEDKHGAVKATVNKFKVPVILTPDLAMDQVAAIAAGEAYIPERALTRGAQAITTGYAPGGELPAASTVDFPAGTGVTAPPPARDPAQEPPKRRRSTTPADVVVGPTGLAPQTNRQAQTATRGEEAATADRREAAARGQFHQGLPEMFRGDDNRPRRHTLYSLATGRVGNVELEELTGPQRNKALRWAHGIADGELELIYEGSFVTLHRIDPPADVATVARPNPDSTDETKDPDPS